MDALMMFNLDGLIRVLKPQKTEPTNDTITIDHATFSKERIKRIEDNWVKDGLIR